MEAATKATITANELRLGNLMVDPLTNSYLRIIELTEEGKIVSTVVDRSKFPLPGGSSTKPIPLTPEILEKCGFDTGKGSDYKFQDLRLRLWKDNSWILLNTNGYDLYPRMPLIKYLHQLQNLYFALAGTELAVNL